MKSVQTADFFLGANGPNGFCSFFEELQQDTREHLYLIKGTPGSGKSTAMKCFAEACEGITFTERIHCSSDPDSLDGVLLPERNIALLDATPPHALEPKLPLAAEETIHLLDCCHADVVKPHTDALRALSAEIAACHRNFRKKLYTADLLLSENRRLMVSKLDFEKLDRQVSRLVKRSLPRKGIHGTEKLRMLSAFTPKGLLRYDVTLSALCGQVILFEDDHAVFAEWMLSLLREELVRRGLSFYCCRSPYDPQNRIEALLIPSLSLGFLAADRKHPYPNAARTLHLQRFLKQPLTSAEKESLRFYRKNAAYTLNAGIEDLKRAKHLHDRLEALYRPAIDFKAVDARFASFFKEINKAV